MKVVINKCYGGFGLSHEAEVEYARRKGIKLYAFIDARAEDGSLDFKHFVPYDGVSDAFLIHYSTKPLNEDGTYDKEAYYFQGRNLIRNDPILVELVEEMGAKANGKHAELKILDIPDNVDWEVCEYDGAEWIAEKHRQWS